MAKRLTDTTKWDDDWFVSLKPENKLFWLFLCDKCDHAGVWKIAPAVASSLIGQVVNLEAALDQFGDRVQVLEGYWYLRKFCKFQYGELDASNRVHRSAIEILETRGLDAPRKALASPYQGAKDKDKEKVKDKDKDSYRTYTNYFNEKYLEKYGEKIISIQGHWIALQNFIKTNSITFEQFKLRADNYFSDPFILSHNQLSFISKWQDMVKPRQTREQAAESFKKAKQREELLKDLRRNR